MRLSMTVKVKGTKRGGKKKEMEGERLEERENVGLKEERRFG